MSINSKVMHLVIVSFMLLVHSTHSKARLCDTSDNSVKLTNDCNDSNSCPTWFSCTKSSNFSVLIFPVFVHRIQYKILANPYSYLEAICTVVQLPQLDICHSLVPRPLPTREKGLVSTACACVNRTTKTW